MYYYARISVTHSGGMYENMFGREMCSIQYMNRDWANIVIVW